MTAKSELELLFPGDGEMAGLMRGKDWASTSLGATATWPNALRAVVRTMLTSRFAMWTGWGDELAFLYNDAYRADTLGSKHPRSLGQPAQTVWSEIWDVVGPRITSMLATGRATWDEGLLLMLERDGYREETYHTFSYSPLHDDDGQVRGVLCVVVEETGRVISERRVALLGALASELATANTDDGALAALRHSLARDDRDLPFTLTYRFDERGQVATLATHTGFTGAPPVPVLLDLTSVTPWPLRELAETGRAVEVALDGGGWPTGPWSVAPARALLMPIAQSGQVGPAGVLIAGINPHRALDAAYREFLLLFVGQLAAGLANARAYERERQRAEDLVALDRAKTTFFSNVSHEFRTPLTLMLGPLDDLLAGAELAPPLRAELATMHRNALRLLKLVNTMLDFSRIEAGRAAAQIVPVNLAQLTTDLASVFRAATEKAGLRLIVDCPRLDRPVPVDRDMWEKIVLNLLSNAFKFTLDGEIAVGLVRRGDQVELTVRDTGCGIPPGELARVFDRFHRVEGTRGRSHEGTGIGLALVQELVRVHGGTIAVASAVGVGTTFTVTIPSVATGVVPIEPRTSDPTRRTNPYAVEAMRWLPDAPSLELEPGVDQRAFVLVADDNADMRDYLRRLLGTRWYVETVDNGRAALAAIARRRPALVITDVMMPELDGFGLIAALRGDPALHDLPVIVVSARAGEEARVAGLQAGAADYLVKPFAARELLATVETQLVRVAVRAAEQDQARHFAAIFAQAPVAIAILRGPDHVFELANQPYVRMVDGRDVVGRTVADALPEVVGQGLIDLLDQVYRTGEPYVAKAMPIQLRGADGGPLDTLFLDFIYEPLRDTAGTIDGIAAVVHDVSALAVARRDAESANLAKDSFLAMLGHELRNPLAPITTALQLMKLRGHPGSERERAVIERQVAHLIGLVDDLLDVSRITRGKVELRADAVEAADVISRSIELVSPLLDERRHQLTVDAGPGLWVRGDLARLAQVVSNLLTNAAKYTPSGGHIVVGARPEGDHVVIQVTDDGIGIEADMLPHIFEPFVQSTQSLDRSRGGLGLGLAIVENLVKLHGGSVTAASAGGGRGTTLTVRLPAIAAPASSGTAPPAARIAAPARIAILVVDDNIDAAELLAEAMQDAGYVTRIAHDGPSALAVAEQFRPAVAILDLGLPVMTGFELARLMRAHPLLAATPLVALTGYGQPQDRAATSAAGFAAHLVKPVDLGKLHAVIKALLSIDDPQ